MIVNNKISRYRYFQNIVIYIAKMVVSLSPRYEWAFSHRIVLILAKLMIRILCYPAAMS